MFFVISGFLITRLISQEAYEKRFSFPRSPAAPSATPSAGGDRLLCPDVVHLLFRPTARSVPKSRTQQGGDDVDVRQFILLPALGILLAARLRTALAAYVVARRRRSVLSHVARFIAVIIPRLSRALVLSIATSLLALSAVIALKTVGVDPEWAFFMLPSRAWELLLGCLLGLLYAGSYSRMAADVCRDGCAGGSGRSRIELDPSQCNLCHARPRRRANLLGRGGRDCLIIATGNFSAARTVFATTGLHRAHLLFAVPLPLAAACARDLQTGPTAEFSGSARSCCRQLCPRRCILELRRAAVSGTRPPPLACRLEIHPSGCASNRRPGNCRQCHHRF